MIPGHPHFSYQNDQLHAENLPLTDIAQQFGTPCYVYSQAALTTAYQAYQRALQTASTPETLICYAVKANPNLNLLALFARLGAGFDIVSGGELSRVLKAGGEAGKVVFSGVGKSPAEIEQALRAGILCFNVESASELKRLNEIAGCMHLKAPVSLRVNPDVDPKTHPYISTGLKANKFGVPHAAALQLYQQAAALPHLHIRGIDCHIGSQLLDPAPALEAAEKIFALVDQLQAIGIQLEHIDLGGGLGIRYQDENVPAIEDYYAPILQLFRGRKERLIVEPGRSLVGNAGLLLSKVETLKPAMSDDGKDFAVIDAAMNDLMRPALYEAWHEILSVQLNSQTPERSWQIVGPVCESGDFLGHDRTLAIAEGHLLALLSAGAYGMSMSSNYNSRTRAAEVLVDGNKAQLIRRRETLEQLYANEVF